VRAERHAEDPVDVSAEGVSLPAVLRIPDLQFAVDPLTEVSAARSDEAAVGTERHAPEPLAVPAEGMHFLAGLRVPESHLPAVIPADGGQAPAVGAEGHPDDIIVAADVEEVLAKARVPDP